MTTCNNRPSKTKKWLLSLATMFFFFMTASAQSVESQGNKNVSKIFKVCPFNVDGLPQKFAGINVNPDGHGAEGAKAIGQYISQSDVDIWGLSEDFNYHNDLANELDKDDFLVGTWRGGINLIKNFPWRFRFDTDGLDLICKKPCSFSQEFWTKWNQNNGYLDQGNDELITKGYRYYLINLGDGVSVDIYIMHMDADTGEKDNAARASQWEQLRDAILANKNGRPIIVMGDTNSRYTRDNILGLFIYPIKEAGEYEVQDAWVEHCKNGIYPTLGDGALMVDKLGYQEGEIVDKVIYLNPKEGKYNLKATNFTVDSDFDKSDHKPVIVTMELTSRNVTTDIKNANGIASTSSVGHYQPKVIYDMNGMRRSQLGKGINIVKMADGSVKKIVY